MSLEENPVNWSGPNEIRWNAIKQRIDAPPDYIETKYGLDHISLGIGETIALSVTAEPGTITDKEYTFVAADPGVVIIKGNKILGRNSGRTRIIARSKDSNEEYSLEILVGKALIGRPRGY